MTIKEILEAKGYRIDLSPSIFYGLKFQDGTIDTSWTFWFLNPRHGYSPTLFLEEIQEWIAGQGSRCGKFARGGFASLNFFKKF